MIAEKCMKNDKVSTFYLLICLSTWPNIAVGNELKTGLPVVLVNKVPGHFQAFPQL